jgi:hypothetical protein
MKVEKTVKTMSRTAKDQTIIEGIFGIRLKIFKMIRLLAPGAMASAYAGLLTTPLKEDAGTMTMIAVVLTVAAIIEYAVIGRFVIAPCERQINEPDKLVCDAVVRSVAYGTLVVDVEGEEKHIPLNAQSTAPQVMEKKLNVGDRVELHMATDCRFVFDIK